MDKDADLRPVEEVYFCGIVIRLVGQRNKTAWCSQDVGISAHIQSEQYRHLEIWDEKCKILRYVGSSHQIHLISPENSSKKKKNPIWQLCSGCCFNIYTKTYYHKILQKNLEGPLI